jgi:hypothetical protein
MRAMPRRCAYRKNETIPYPDCSYVMVAFTPAEFELARRFFSREALLLIAKARHRVWLGGPAEGCCRRDGRPRAGSVPVVAWTI